MIRWHGIRCCELLFGQAETSQTQNKSTNIIFQVVFSTSTIDIYADSEWFTYWTTAIQKYAKSITKRVLVKILSIFSLFKIIILLFVIIFDCYESGRHIPSFTSALSVRSTFCPLMSRWITLLECRWDRPCQSQHTNIRLSTAGNHNTQTYSNQLQPTTTHKHTVINCSQPQHTHTYGNQLQPTTTNTHTVINCSQPQHTHIR